MFSQHSRIIICFFFVLFSFYENMYLLRTNISGLLHRVLFLSDGVKKIYRIFSVACKRIRRQYKRHFFLGDGMDFRFLAVTLEIP